MGSGSANNKSSKSSKALLKSNRTKSICASKQKGAIIGNSSNVTDLSDTSQNECR